MALDYLPIQASAVPSERVFSSSADTDTKKRNRINPTLMEALQILKYIFRHERLDFMQGWATPESFMLGAETDTHNKLSEVLSGEDAVDDIIRAMGYDDVGHTQ